MTDTKTSTEEHTLVVALTFSGATPEKGWPTEPFGAELSVGSELWSVQVKPWNPVGADNKTRAWVSFLSADAPLSKLRPKDVLTLTRGHRPIAQAKVLVYPLAATGCVDTAFIEYPNAPMRRGSHSTENRNTKHAATYDRPTKQ